jgi:hypothetical protein
MIDLSSTTRFDTPSPPRSSSDTLRPGPDSRPRVRLLLATGLLLLGVFPTSAAPPDEGQCPTVSGTDEAGESSEDAAPILLREGMTLDKTALLALRSLLPGDVWRHREVFFFEGMQMLIGSCHRRYPIPEFYEKATETYRGQASVDNKGNLRDYTAGLPFPQDEIDPEDEKAAERWAWNFEKRFRGAGHEGKFRMVTFPSRLGGVQRYKGEIFMLPVSERADLADQEYAIGVADGVLWAVGGEFTSPFSARGLAWRQFRKSKSLKRWNQPDDIFVYIPEMRKMRRAATRWVDGAFVPNFKVAGQYGGGGVVYGESGSINPTAGVNISASEDARAGLTGLFLRPNAYVWRLIGEQVVIAPINGHERGYPLNPDRNYGVSGMSPATDRWDVRQAIVIEGALRERNETIRTVTIYLDYQTLHPLYWITRTSKRRLLDVGILVHQFMGDVREAPSWPDSGPNMVFVPVSAFFYNALAGKGGWMRESYDLSSTPFDERDHERMTTSDTLQRGH